MFVLGFAKNNDIVADISAAWNAIEDALNRVLKNLACAVSQVCCQNLIFYIEKVLYES